MTAFWVILGCIGFILAAGTSRRRPGVAMADVSLLLFLLAVIAIADLVMSRFFYTGEVAWTVAGLLAFGFALDALYGLMAPGRQRRRDQRLRALLRRKAA